MLQTRMIRAALAAVLLAAAPAAAQQPAPQIPDSARPLIQEFQEIQARLGAIQAQAMQDTALQRMEAEATEAMRTAMLELNPQLLGQIARLDTLRTEIAEAQQAQDAERLQALAREGMQIQQTLETTQAQAAQQPEVAAAVEEYRTALVAEMIEVEPETQALLDRLEEVGQRLQAMQ